MSQDIRWKQRFQNFEKAEKLLAEIADYDENGEFDIACEGFIQRFEFTFELAWKTMKDYLEYLLVEVEPSPRFVIQEAYEKGIIPNAQIFIEMAKSCNKMSHEYDREKFKEIYFKIKNEYQPAIHELYEFFKEKL